MTNETTIEKLREMRLTAFAESLQEQLSDSSSQSLSFEERLGILVDVEWSSRKNNRLRRLIKSADFDQSHASISGIDYRPARKLNKSEILRLATGKYINDHHNIIMLYMVLSLPLLP